jgi:hypothetical protein
MDTRNDSTLIPIPSIVDDARWIGRFSREVRKSITALRDRRQVMTKLPNLNYLHPFKLFTLDTATERRLYVGPGRVTMMQWNGTAVQQREPLQRRFRSILHEWIFDAGGIEDLRHLVGNRVDERIFLKHCFRLGCV